MPSNFAESLVLPISIYTGSEWQCSAVKFANLFQRLTPPCLISTGGKCHLCVVTSDSFSWTACALLLDLYRKRVSFTCPCNLTHFDERLALPLSISIESIIYVSSHLIRFAERFALPFFITTVGDCRLRILISDLFCWIVWALLLNPYRKWVPPTCRPIVFILLMPIF